MSRPVACRVLGCRWDFRAAGDTVMWTCARGCGGGGRACTAGAEEAQRLVRQLDRGRPGPPLGLLALLGGIVHRPRSGFRG
ncbi:hypothetical protein [Pseudonocardia asaccharolytica]|uniref:Uncharacterized protein n=1 Tax=Pseudonocardia asaccharolytica DSM 44247 = NBRC 16224 TaxID=1123024 RepID=A0A511D2K8_9PSEU|nr:hypothetical protein [Pseudonocardia asaccharolytica]GEL19025.1 hypothetical protein PA7_28620 [Pseudonocardia asaccharolytica DSM 44247 = NBRC 16224]